MSDPALGIVYSPRFSWSADLQRHLANHGGAHVKRMILEPRIALEEEFDIFVCDDTTSFLSAHFVDALVRRGVRLIGVYAADEPAGRDRLLNLGFDGVLGSDATVDDFLREIDILAPTSDAGRGVRADDHPIDLVPNSQRARRVVVGGTSGGCGATEFALALATSMAATNHIVLFDADNVHPTLSIRLSAAQIPNIRNAVDSCLHGLGSVGGSLQAVGQMNLDFLAGVTQASDWASLRPGDVGAVVDELAATGSDVVIDVGHRLEDLESYGAPRYGLARSLIADADTIVGVGAPTPSGVVRILDWVGEVRDITGVPIHIVVSRAPRSSFKRSEIETELRRSFNPASLTFAPFDRRVEEASWSSRPVNGGPYARSASELANLIIGRGGNRRRKSWKRAS